MDRRSFLGGTALAAWAVAFSTRGAAVESGALSTGSASAGALSAGSVSAGGSDPETRVFPQGGESEAGNLGLREFQRLSLQPDATNPLAASSGGRNSCLSDMGSDPDTPYLVGTLDVSSDPFHEPPLRSSRRTYSASPGRTAQTPYVQALPHTGPTGRRFDIGIYQPKLDGWIIPDELGEAARELQLCTYAVPLPGWPYYSDRTGVLSIRDLPGASGQSSLPGVVYFDREADRPNSSGLPSVSDETLPPELQRSHLLRRAAGSVTNMAMYTQLGQPAVPVQYRYSGSAMNAPETAGASPIRVDVSGQEREAQAPDQSAYCASAITNFGYHNVLLKAEDTHDVVQIVATNSQGKSYLIRFMLDNFGNMISLDTPEVAPPSNSPVLILPPKPTDIVIGAPDIFADQHHPGVTYAVYRYATSVPDDELDTSGETVVVERFAFTTIVKGPDGTYRLDRILPQECPPGTPSFVEIGVLGGTPIALIANGNTITVHTPEQEGCQPICASQTFTLDGEILSLSTFIGYAGSGPNKMYARAVIQTSTGRELVQFLVAGFNTLLYLPFIVKGN